jgi:hypothetical protein
MQTSSIPYLTLNDYLPSIQSGQLNNQILDAIERGGKQQRLFAESWAIGKVIAILGEYFDLDFEITPTLPYRNNRKYHAGERVVLDYDEWTPSNGSQDEQDSGRIFYPVGRCVIKYKDDVNKLFGTAYICKNANYDTIWIDSNWQAIGNQYDVYYIAYPYPVFHLDVEEARGITANGFYRLNDIVCYANHTWRCKMQTISYSHSTLEQYISTSNIPPQNYFPTEPNNPQWEDLGEYYFIGEAPHYIDEDIEIQQNIGIGGTSSFGDGGDENSEDSIVQPDKVQSIINGVWTLGDNRDPVLVQALVDLSIWRLHNRISPNNIPDLRETNKNTVFQWLRDVRGGEQGVSIPRFQPTQIGDISFGANIKKRNGY